ncbi:MAG TPA: DinB family protein [Terriglobales bacterium]|nr:DinB family protein [Terriglobales bacterium]
MKPLRRNFTILSLLLLACILPARAQSGSGSTAPASQRDGQHDFDFELGSWKIHLKRRLHPLTGSNTWTEFDGTSVTRKVWDGRAQIEEFETDGAAGHIEGLTLRTYNPQTHQWNLYWVNSKKGTMEVPQVGEFKDGVGEFYAMDTLDGKAILVRFIWSKTDSNMPHFEQSFSQDGGKSWEVNWITDQTRVAADARSNTSSTSSGTTPPASTIASVVDREITNAEKQIVELAEAMPQDRFDFSPEALNISSSDYKGVRTFALEVKHVAASNFAIWAPITGDKFPKDYIGGNGPENLKTKAEIIQFLKDSFALGHKAAATLTTDNFLENPEGSKSTRLRLAEFAVEHAYDHYGQMVEYLRLNGIVPPASRKQAD